MPATPTDTDVAGDWRRLRRAGRRDGAARARPAPPSCWRPPTASAAAPGPPIPRRSAASGSTWARSGCTGAERNPLVPIAQAAGDTLLRSDELRQQAHLRRQRARRHRPNTPTTTRPGRATRPPPTVCCACMPDAPLAAVADHRPGRSLGADGGGVGRPGDLRRGGRASSACATGGATRWTAATWCRKAASAPSSRGGWATGLDIRLNTPVTRLRWNGPGGRVTVETPRGTLSAARRASSRCPPACWPPARWRSIPRCRPRCRTAWRRCRWAWR